MTPKPKIVFLYSEIAGYFLACAKELAKFSEVLIIKWPVNSEAPFKFDIPDGLSVIEKNDYSNIKLLQLINTFNPDKIVCSGWMDKDYLKIVKSFKKRIPTILTLDNHWEGSLKQKVASMISPFYLKRIFTHAWVPGSPQEKFANKLGFNKVIKGFYCSDNHLFEGNFNASNIVPEKTFLYVGRYVDVKSIKEMWQAFIQLVEENNLWDWKMVCIGTGDLWEERVIHDQIEHMGFLQPGEISKFLIKKPIYILPSNFEPWGVSVQEFAISGCPLIISENVGASEMFIKEGQNGYMVKPTISSIKSAMNKFIYKSNDELVKMSINSNELGMSYSPNDWANRLLKVTL